MEIFFENRDKCGRQEALPPVTPDALSCNHFESGEDLWFTNTLTGKRHKLVTSRGRFVDFPGVEDFPGADAEERACLAKARAAKQIYYCAYFEPFGRENYVVWWTAQPDGRYWEDEDGYGGTSDSEIQLYALLDRTGHYTGPFRLRSTGSTYYVWNYRKLSLRFCRDLITGDGSRLVDVVDQQYEKGKEPPIRKVPAARVSYYNRGESIRYEGKKFADIEALKKDRILRSVTVECQEPLPGREGRCRHLLYEIRPDRVNCVTWEDGVERVTVTEEVDRVRSCAWKEMVKKGIVEDEDICVR